MKVKIPLKLNSWNDIIRECRANKYSANSHKQAEMRDISWFVKNIPPIKEYPIEIVFTWHMRGNADLDGKSCKSILDCMQNLGIIENDNIGHISKITYIAVKDKEEYVEMEIL